MSLSHPRAYWPTIDWKELAPQDAGMELTLLKQMQTYIDRHIPGLYSLLIARHGYLVFEYYAHDYTAHDVHYPASAIKSLISALLGIALHRGVLQHLDQTLSDVLPTSLLSEVEQSKKEITLRSLLTMTSGLAREGEYTLAFDERMNFVTTLLEHPLQEKVFRYNNNGPHLLLYLLMFLTQMSVMQFANTYLFQPLGISTDEQWRITEQGWYPSAFPVGRLFLKPRDMLKFGYLYLNNGLWEGRQIIPAKYIADSTRQQSEGGWPVGMPYGYLWWITRYGQHPAFFASGLGGQHIFVIPTLDIVIVTTASIEHMHNDLEQEEKIRSLVPGFILPAISNNLVCVNAMP